MDATSDAVDRPQDPPIPEALYTEHDGLFVPSEFTRGPWRSDAQHGGPPAALLAHLCEPHVGADEFLTQLDVELVASVPLTPLDTTVVRRQVSRRVARVDAQLRSGDAVVAHASALVLRTTELAPPAHVDDETTAPQPPSAEAAVEPPRWANGEDTTYHRNAVEHRFTAGDFRIPGPAVDWVRLRLPVVAGHEPSGLQRVAAAADFGSGISAVYPSDSSVGLINANLVISVHRAMVGEWVSIDATTRVGAQGTGLGISQLGDVEGTLGVATQSLLGLTLRR